MKTLLLILAASLLVTALFRAVLRLVRANREEQRDTEPSPGFSVQAQYVEPGIHHLKTWPQFFKAVAFGCKTFEWRKDDRGFEVGHFLVLEEWDPEKAEYTGRQLLARVTYVLRDGFDITPGYAVLGLRVLDQPPKLNPDLPPLDFGELPDVTEDAVESAAKVLSEPPPKGEVA